MDLECSEDFDDSVLNNHLQNAQKGVNRSHKLQTLADLAPLKARKDPEKKKRGRKPRSKVGPSILREVTEYARGLDPTIPLLQAAVESTGSGGYITRATKAWFLCKPAGLSFPGSDKDAIRGFAAEWEEDNPRNLLGQ